MMGISARVIGAIVGAVLLIVGLVLLVNSCQARRSADKQAEVSKEQGQASINAGAAAMNTVSGVVQNDASTDETVAQGQASIRNAPEGQKGQATIAASCRFKAYQDDPQCKGPAK